MRNTKGIDILASNADATKSVGIQVKTQQGTGKEWIVNKKVESEIATNLVFIFVRLNGLAAPEYYIVPREDVAEFAREGHERWMSGQRRDGNPRKDGSMRKFADAAGHYRDQWDFLGLG